MKLAYVSLIDLAAQSGAVDHVLGLGRALARRGHHVTLIAYTSRPDQPIAGAPGLTVRAWPAPAGGSPARRIMAFAAHARRQVAAEPFDLVYLRPFPLDYMVLTRHFEAAGLPYVYELNALVEDEYRSKAKWLRGKLYAFSEARSLVGAAGWLPVTNEILAWCRDRAGAATPAMVTWNGVSLEEVAVRRSRAEVRAALGVPEDRPVMAMLGFTRPWHGSDRAIAMLPEMPRDAEVWLIGAKDEQDRRKAEEAARRHGVEHAVRVFPWMAPAEAADLVNAADLGLGQLAPYLAEAQPLKNGFYLALGLPVLMVHPDLRIPADAPYARLLGSAEPRELARAASEMIAVGSDREAVRAFARAHLSWSAVAERTEAFLAPLVRMEEVPWRALG